MRMSRAWAMPSPHTFSIPPITNLLKNWLNGKSIILDPFSGRSTVGTHRNDLNPDLCESGVDAEEFCQRFLKSGVKADAVLFDPPYSPRQISECYKSIGLPVGTKDTQNSALYKRVRDVLDLCLRVGGVAISCGWNSGGFGKVRGYTIEEILLVAHGGAHNDTIVVVERKTEKILRSVKYPPPRCV